MVANGVDIVTGKNLMGHATAKMLTELYAHCAPENMSTATELIGSVLFNEKSATIMEIDSIAKTAWSTCFVVRFVPDLYQPNDFTGFELVEYVID